MQATEKIWMNGELVDWADAKIHVASHGLNYGSGVFEGIRCYDTSKGPAVFRLEEHLVRLENSAQAAVHGSARTRSRSSERRRTSVVAVNGNASCYIRPLAFYGFGELGVSSVGNPVDVVILSFPWGAYLGEDSQTKGITAKISSWERVGPNVIPHVAKATGIYLNSMLATMEARRGGYDEAIMLSHDGYVADGPGENIFVVKDGVLLHAAALDVDPARDHARYGHHDRAGPRLSASRRRCSSAPTSTSPTRCSWSGRRPRSRRCVRSTTRRSASARSRASCRRRTSPPSTGWTSAGLTTSTWSS